MDELAQKIAGDVITSVPEAFHHDFGNIKRITPQALIIAAHVEDVQAAVAYAYKHGLRIVARGHGCSSYGQSLSDQLLLDTHNLKQVDLVADDQVVVGAGCRWGDFQEYLVERGRTSNVVVSNDKASVAGTLSVGGFSPAALAHGALVDQVTALDIVSGTGELIRAYKDGPHQKLFEYTLCGLGQIGIIVAAHIMVAPYKPYTVLEQRSYPASTDLEWLARSIAEEADWDHCRVIYVNGNASWRVELGRTYEEAPAEVAPGAVVVKDYFRQIFEKENYFAANFATRQVQQGLLDTPEHIRRIWSDFFLPVDRSNAFFNEVKDRFSNPFMALGFNGTLLRQHPGKRRLPLLPVPETPLVQSFGPYCFVPPDQVNTYLEHFDYAAMLCQELGGRQYLHGYHRNSSDFYRQQFGVATLEAWMSVKHQYDPGHVLGASLFDM